MTILSNCEMNMIDCLRVLYIVQIHDFFCFQIIFVAAEVRTHPAQTSHFLIMECIQEVKSLSSLSQKMKRRHVERNVKTNTCAEVLCFTTVRAV